MSAGAATRILRGQWPEPARVAAAGFLGALMGWSVSTEHLAPVAAAALPLLVLSFGARRFVAPFVGACAYFLVALRGLFAAAPLFFPTPAQSLAGQFGLVATCILIGLLWTLPRRWVSAPRQAAWVGVATTIAAAMPPLWIVGGVAHPLLAYGFLWPGGGWFAIAVLLVATWFAARWMFARPAAIQCAVLAGVVLAAFAVDATPKETRGTDAIRASSTHWPGRDAVELDVMSDRLWKVGRLVRGLAPLGVKWIVLPESTVPRWTPALNYVLNEEVAKEARREHVDVWLGISSDGASPAVTVTAFGADGSTRVFNARQPMPLSLWRPWDPTGYSTHWFEPGMVPSWIGPVYLSICYEDLMPGMFLWDMLRQGRPNAIVSVANSWYLPPSAALAQARHVESMARLFSLPLLRAVNLPGS